ncbi:potassium transporter 19 [Penicillium riverlandense]|uniref:potassium transporter 19 n=1 Tax=Penicillium riverlandense TaxID=1903569 RepID=UPI00254951DC|nr:potassium transporter 19 [Penicillium riverlandense]KAJ5833421.1 potassium transporter 19 [Penicillium riverlandense]
MDTEQEDDIAKDVYTSSTGGGVYSSRLMHALSSSQQGRNLPSKVADIEMTSVSEQTEVDERDFRKKQVFSGWTLAWLSYQSLGVIYGDIGTSPLYVFSSTFSNEPSREDILGAVSLIIWALTIMVTIKYVCIVLNADDEGEGGTFAVYSLLSRYARIVRFDPRHANLVPMRRFNTNDLQKPNRATRNIMERSRFLKWMLKTVGAFGVSLLLADGILTPAQSILGAIQGITVINPDISSSTVVGVSCAILVVTFLIQPFGTSKIASAFAPIVIVWLLFNLTFGIYNLVKYDALILKAFSPYFAGSFLVRNGRNGWLSLGGILLAFTGVETLFADLGAFSQRAIQISWLFFVYPCLLVSYIGQGAHISVVPSAYANPFFFTVPPGMLYPSLVVAILACIVASQAVITGSFQLLSQLMKLSYLPQIKIYHVSKVFHGQVYIPLANWFMMIGTIIVTAVYNNTTALGEAYGTCVILVSFLTTCMVTVVALIVWRLPAYLVLPVFVIVALWDGMFLSAALIKVPHGAWFTLMVAIALTCIFNLWRYGKEEQWTAEESDNVPLSKTTILQNNSLCLQDAFGGSIIAPVKGVGIFFDKAGSSVHTPTVFLHFLQKFSAAPEITVFLHLRLLSVPSVAPNERYTINRCFTGPGKQVIRNCFRLIVRHGYTDEIVTADLGNLVFDLIRSYLEGQAGSNVPSDEPEEMTALFHAWRTQTIYIVGKEQLKVLPTANILRRIILWVFLWMRDSSRTKIQHLNVESDRLVEIGFVKTM